MVDTIFITYGVTNAKNEYPIYGPGHNQILNVYESDKKIYLIHS